MIEKKSKTLIVLLGPTGVGKTDTSIQLAQKLDCPIISADSRQLFREMKIGTAAPTAEILNKVKHYFIGSHSIFDKYNAGIYEQEVLKLLENLFNEHDVVLMTGGSMLYIDIVCKGMDDVPSVDTKTRENWQRIYDEKGLEYIQEELRWLDPQHYNKVDLMNYKRILHALEICTISGKPFSEFRTGKIKKRPFNILKIGLNLPREILYERINNRVNIMMSDGLLNEVETLYPHRYLNSLNTVGYKELFGYLDGEYDLNEAIRLIQKHTRVYARKQLTWFQRDYEIHWFQPDQVDKIINYTLTKINR